MKRAFWEPDINIIQAFAFAIDRTFFKEGKVTKVYEIIVPKESGPYLH